MKWLILSRLAQQDNELSPRCDAIFDKNNSIFTLFKINFALWLLYLVSLYDITLAV